TGVQTCALPLPNLHNLSAAKNEKFDLDQRCDDVFVLIINSRSARCSRATKVQEGLKEAALMPESGTNETARSPPPASWWLERTAGFGHPCAWATNPRGGSDSEEANGACRCVAGAGRRPCRRRDVAVTARQGDRAVRAGRP